jgi:DNA repair exonuclease SbcCD nuclease subunit
MKQPNAILTADIHARDTVPICRTDDFFLAQSNKIKFIKNLQEKYGNIPILDAGDLLDKWKSSPYLEAWSIRNLPYIVTVPGNHELPSHNISYLDKSSLSVLEAAGKILILKDNNELPYFLLEEISITGFPWNTPIKKYEGNFKGRRVAIAHILTYESESIWPGLVAIKGIDLLKKMSGFDLIITGHNHLPFISKYKGRLLVNPGSMTRAHADQINHKPRVYLWFSEDNSIEEVYLPIEENVISREHIERKEKRNERVDSFVNRLKDNHEISVSFEKNLEAYFSTNRVRYQVKDLIQESING